MNKGSRFQQLIPALKKLFFNDISNAYFSSRILDNYVPYPAICISKTKFQTMRKSLRFLVLLLAAFSMSTQLFAQTVTVTGTVRNAGTQEGIPAVSVTIRGGQQGTFTDASGNFTINVARVPAVLIISSVGFESTEVTVTDASKPVQVALNVSSSMGQEVVVSATRSTQRILEAPVTVERMNSAVLRNVPAPSYYEAIANLKGVDMHTASLTFRTVTTRGFMSSGNLRLNQLIDGMDNQAPGLNFSVGSVVGLTELDVDNIELLAGASSALYGSGGMNGTLLINSKNPFQHQGLSYQIKQGVMHLGSPSGTAPSPYYDWSMRYAKSIGEKFAFKLTGQFLRANDWEAYDNTNFDRNNVIGKVKEGNRLSDPNYDGVNVYGDETQSNIFDVVRSLYNAFGRPDSSTNFLANPGLPSWRFAFNNTPNQSVSRTGYQERDLVDYNTMNFKFSGGLHYKIAPGIEASFNTYYGSGTTVYTGIDRYSLRNLKMAQHKLEVKGNTWFVRGYTTQENSGDSYANTILGRLINESWKPSTTWYPQYIANFVGYKATALANTGTVGDNYTAHQIARGVADRERLQPGTAQFNTTVDAIKSRAIPNGAKFQDRSDLWAGEAQLNISDQFGFSNTVEVIAGGQFKQFVLNSQGTIFADTLGTLKPAEYGAYVQFKKRLLEDRLTLTASGRYDDHTNFDGRFTPRLTAVIKIAKDNNIRVSYQTAYRFPTNQDQYINLNSGAAILIGHIPEFQDFYRVGTNPTYTAASIGAARATGDLSRLVRAPYAKVKPESVSTYEIGYKGIVTQNLFIDAYAYMSDYTDFLGRIAVGQSSLVSYGGAPDSGVPPSPAHLLNPGTTRNLSYVQSTDQNIQAIGWGITSEYKILRNSFLYGNVFGDKLRNVPANVVTSFNAPKIRFNLGLRNENIYKNIGFNVVYRWQDENYYEGTFGTGTIPSFGWLDAQLSYKIPSSKSLIRIGGTNILNDYQRTAFGNPYVGGLYYASFGYNL
jgi:outer membrane cobalamin receptor